MIDKLYIMALDRRKELWQELEQECVVRGFSTQLFIVGDGKDPALTYNHIDSLDVDLRWNWGQGESGRRHCYAFFSHKQIIKDAIKNNYNNIMLLEDDACFTSRFDKEWPAVQDELSKLDFDFVQLGWHSFEYSNHLFAGQNIIIEDEYKRTGRCYISSLKQAGGLFGCIINRRLFNLLMNMPPIAPIDHQINFLRRTIKHYAVIPSIVYVKSCWSSCENQFINRDNL